MDAGPMAKVRYECMVCVDAEGLVETTLKQQQLVSQQFARVPLPLASSCQEPSGKKRILQKGKSGRAILVHTLLGPRLPPFLFFPGGGGGLCCQCRFL